MTKSDDWYRSPGWTDADQEEFARRLRRARHHTRYQYRRIKSVALLSTNDRAKRTAAETLLGMNIASDEVPDFEKAWAHSLLAQSARTAGDRTKAERHFRAALELAGPGGSGLNGEEEVELAELLLAKNTPDATLEAKAWLERRAEEMPLFLRSQFRLCSAMAEVLLRLNQREVAGEWAERALELSTATHSGLTNHPRLGLIEADPRTIQWLQSVAQTRISSGFH